VTFDADCNAAPLSASVVDGLSSPRALELISQSIALEEQRLLQVKVAKEEHFRRRLQKREAGYGGGKEAKETRDGSEGEVKVGEGEHAGDVAREWGGEGV
jgi:hypothetical protein